MATCGKKCFHKEVFWKMGMKKMLAVVAAATLVATAAPAFAANPFSDVPANHWAYDAIEQLAAKGVLEGYPNGTYRGGRTMTRYEIAAMVARLMDAGLTGEELERLKALVVEFQPELEALGVKVDGIDSRVTALEKGLKGWKISGEMQFDYNSFGKDFDKLGDDAPARHGFEFDTARIYLHRDMEKGLSFDLELGDGAIDRYYMTAEDFLGIDGLTIRLGQFDIDYEGDDELYYDEHEDAGFLMGYTYRGGQITKSFGLAEFTAFAASNMGDDGISVYDDNESGEYYGARLKFDFNEKAWLSGNFYESKPGEDPEVGVCDFKAYWVGAGFKFAEGIELKGAYYWEDIEEPEEDFGDSPKAWKAILSVDQDVLKFTSLWFEYAQFDRGFVCESAPYAFHSFTSDLLGDNLTPMPEDTDVLFVALKQEWTEKWSTFERYHHYDIDDQGKIKDWAVGIGYQYTPNLYFELAYNKIDLSGMDEFLEFKDEGIVRFRTLFTF